MEILKDVGSREIPLSRAISMIIASAIIVSIIGTVVGYLFFWNKYETVSKEDVAVSERMKLVEKYPQDYRSYLAVGASYLEKGDPNSALEWFRKAEQLKKDDLTVQFNIGLAYYSLKNYDEAVKMMTPLAQKSRMNFDIQYYMGAVYYAKGDFDKAIDTFKWAIELRPAAADANLFLAKTYYKKGDKKLAQEHLDKAMKMVPYYKEAIDFKQAMEANKPID